MNRWVGIVALREPSAPTPVHRIALAIEAARRRTSYRLGSRDVPYARMRAALRTLGQEHARHYEWERYTYCVELAGDFFDGGQPPAGLPFWLMAELQDVLDGRNAPSRAVGGRNKQSSARKPQRSDRHRAPVPPPRRSKRPAVRDIRPAQPKAGHRPPPERVEPYARVARQLEVRDIDRPALCEPPAALVGTFGEVVRAVVQEKAGNWAAGSETTAWLGLASSHRSHLYESGLSEAAVSPLLLGMLDRLGRTTLAVVLLDAYTKSQRPEKVGTQSAEHNRRWTVGARALGQWAMGRGLVRMGSGEAQRPAPSVAETVARQILGTLSLLGAHETARRLVEAVCDGLDQPVDEAGGADPTTKAQEAFAKEGLTFEYDEDGPDHSKTFLATARTRTGRLAVGTGANKKTARAAASRALLRDHPPTDAKVSAATRPGAAATAGPTEPPRSYRTAHPAHQDAVADLLAMFELSGDQARGLLTQALTHSSYVYENAAAATAARQRDNQLLAHHGSVVLDHLSTLTKTRRVLVHGLVPDEDEARIHTPANEDTARLGAALAIAEGVLAGHGADKQRIGMAADGAQAVVASAWRAHGPRLLRRRPVVLDDWLTELEHRHDPTTVLNYLASAFGMTYTFEHQLTGLDHMQSFTSTLILCDARGRTQRWTVAPEGPGTKTDADRAVAQEVLDILAAPADDLVEALTDPERGLLTYLLRAQLDGLGQTTERQRTRIVSRGELGTDLLVTGDTEAFLTWSDRITVLLGADGTKALEVSEALRELYRKVIDDARRGPRSLLRRMAADAGTVTADAVRRHAADAVRRALATGPRTASVRDVVQDWWRDQAPHTGVTVRDDMRLESFLPLSVHLGALRETLTWCGEAAAAAGTRIDIELTVQDGTLHLWMGLPGIDVGVACDDFAQLLSRTLPYTDCLVDDDHVLLRLHRRPERHPLAPLAAAGLDAYMTASTAKKEPISCVTP
ncbi:putative dsRNA-binding protein [Streptomyces californicus]|uniref:putative dsRNA-binding protein n=1 Tax=Streptomyces californicus TaxID=67351 RepID=UPI00367445A5